MQSLIQLDRYDTCSYIRCLRLCLEAQRSPNIGKSFDPEKHGMVMCPECKGHGKLPEGPEGASVCSKCGGFGLVKKEENRAEQNLGVVKTV